VNKLENTGIRDDETYSDYKRRKREEKGLQSIDKKTVTLMVVFALFISLLGFGVNEYSKNQRRQEAAIINENPDAYYANKFVSDTEEMDTDRLNIYCSQLVFDFFRGSKGNSLIKFSEYFSKVDETCFSIKEIAEEASQYIKEGEGYETLNQHIQLNTSSILLKDSISKFLKEEEFNKECRDIKSKYVGVISRPLLIIDRATDIVVFPEKVTRAQADKFFDESLQDLKNINYDINNSSIKSVVRKVYLISNSDVSQGLLQWQEGFWRFKAGYSSYESYYTRGDVYLDRASDALRELQEEYNSLTC
jgi:hypothetical protein